MFGYTDALRLRTPSAVHALLLLVAIGLLVYAAYRLYKGARTSGIVIGLLGIGFLAWFLLTDAVPREFTGMTPYVATLLVLSLATQRLRMPAADGQVYRKGSAGVTTRRRVGLSCTARRSRRCGTPTRRTPTTRSGAAGLVDDGRLVSGCNVENAAYGVALCAECGMVSQLHRYRRRPADPRRLRRPRRRRDHAVRTVPAAALRERRPGPAADDRARA